MSNFLHTTICNIKIESNSSIFTSIRQIETLSTKCCPADFQTSEHEKKNTNPFILRPIFNTKRSKQWLSLVFKFEFLIARNEPGKTGPIYIKRNLLHPLNRKNYSKAGSFGARLRLFRS